MNPLTKTTSLYRTATALLLRRPILTIFVIALFARVAAILAMPIIFETSPVLDDLTYSTMAEEAARGATAHWDDYTSRLYDSTATLLIPLTFIYRVFGSNPQHGQLFVALLGAGTAAGATFLTIQFMSVRWALLTGAVVALLPSQILWSSLILKDAAVWLTLVALSIVVVKAGKSQGGLLIAWGLLLLLVLTALAYLRVHTFVVACWAIALTAWTGQIRLRWARVGAGAAVALLLPWILGLGPFGLSFVQQSSDFQGLRAVHSYGAQSGVVAPPETQVEERTDIVINQTSKRVGLSPEQVRSLIDQASSSEAVSKPGTAVEEERIARLAQETGLSEEQASEVLNDFEVQSLLATRRQPFVAPEPAEGADALEANIRYLPRGIAVMLFAPAPWQDSTSQSMKLAQYETWVWYPIVILALMGLPTMLRRFTRRGFILVLGAGILLMYALGEGNIGTAYRHRGEIVWIAAVLGTMGAASVWNRCAGRLTPTSQLPKRANEGVDRTIAAPSEERPVADEKSARQHLAGHTPQPRWGRVDASWI